MSIPLLVFLALYLLVLIGFIVFSAIALYHIQRFGFADWDTLASTLLFFVVAGAIVAGTLIALIGVDWSQGIELMIPISLEQTEEASIPLPPQE